MLFYWLVSWDLLMIMPSAECHVASLKISQHWLRWWLGAVRHQAITWANVDPELCHYMASLDHNELMHMIYDKHYANLKCRWYHEWIAHLWPFKRNLRSTLIANSPPGLFMMGGWSNNFCLQASARTKWMLGFAGWLIRTSPALLKYVLHEHIYQRLWGTFTLH